MTDCKKLMVIENEANTIKRDAIGLSEIRRKPGNTTIRNQVMRHSIEDTILIVKEE